MHHRQRQWPLLCRHGCQGLLRLRQRHQVSQTHAAHVYAWSSCHRYSCRPCQRFAHASDFCLRSPAFPCLPCLLFSSGFMAMGARGISVMVSSGDSGAHGRTDPSCATAKVHPDWPAASPYITAVGASTLPGLADECDNLSSCGISTTLRLPRLCLQIQSLQVQLRSPTVWLSPTPSPATARTPPWALARSPALRSSAPRPPAL